MIQSLWIALDTGQCLVHRNYAGLNHDENLITSILTTIEIFAQNVDAGCEVVQTRNYKFVFTAYKNTITIACVERNDDERTIRKDLEDIQLEFHSRFSSTIENWTGDIELFFPLFNFIDNRLNKYGTLYNLSKTILQLNQMIIKESTNFRLSPHQEKVVSLLKYKGSATLNDIIRYMKIDDGEAEKATRGLLYQDIVRQISPN